MIVCREVRALGEYPRHGGRARHSETARTPQNRLSRGYCTRALRGRSGMEVRNRVHERGHRGLGLASAAPNAGWGSPCGTLPWRPPRPGAPPHPVVVLQRLRCAAWSNKPPLHGCSPTATSLSLGAGSSHAREPRARYCFGQEQKRVRGLAEGPRVPGSSRSRSPANCRAECSSSRVAAARGCCTLARRKGRSEDARYGEGVPADVTAVGHDLAASEPCRDAPRAP